MTRLTWFTSDFHFGHQNIIGFCDRPWDTIEQMNHGLVWNFNMHVGEDDFVIVLGDVAMGKIDESLPFISMLHGHKVLVPGNHDRCWHAHKKRIEEWTDKYLEAGFDDIWSGDAHTYSLKDEIGTKQVTLSHFPYSFEHQSDIRYMDNRPVDNGEWLLHGHVHDTWKFNEKMINVGVDVWDYAPVSEEQIMAHIREVEAND